MWIRLTDDRTEKEVLVNMDLVARVTEVSGQIASILHLSGSEQFSVREPLQEIENRLVDEERRLADLGKVAR